MKVFISWSGERSKAIAAAFHGWLPTIIQQIEPWMSEHDIDKGSRGLPAIAQQLEETQFGLICITPESMNAPWLLFEAGALSKSQAQSRVWTVLHQLEYADIKGPLSQFQHTKIERDDVLKLVRAINTAAGETLLKEPQLETAFRRGWPDLEQMIGNVPEVEEAVPDRSEKDMIQEILELVRKQSRERQKNSYDADRYMSVFMPLLLTAFRNDPNLKDSEMARTAEELEADARYRLHFMNELLRNQASQRTPWDFTAGSSDSQRLEAMLRRREARLSREDTKQAESATPAEEKHEQDDEADK